MNKACVAILWALAATACDGLGGRGPIQTKLDPPYQEMSYFPNDTKVSVRLMPGEHIAALFPLDAFAGFEPGISASAARTKFGEPTAVKTEKWATITTYSRPGGEIEIFEFEVHPESNGAPFTQSDLRLRLRAPLQSDTLSVLVRRMLAEVPTVKEVAILSKVPTDPVLRLHIDGGRVVVVGINEAPPPGDGASSGL